MSESTRNNWTINLLLTVILALLIGFYLDRMRTASAAGGGWETDGVMAMASGAINERLVLIDTKKQSVMIYRAQQGGLFRLSGARSYQYDIEVIDSDKVPQMQHNGIPYHVARDLYEKTNPSTP